MENSTQTVIVLVEDNEVLLRMYEQALVTDGFQVFTAQNGKAGFDLIKEHKPAIILSDIMMPDTNGLQLLEMIKNDSDTSLNQIPVLMLSNLDSQEYIDKATELGVTEYFVKDENEPKDIVIKVKEILSKLEKPQQTEELPLAA